MKHKVVGDIGVLGASSHTGCPNCNTDLGYYGDLGDGFTCDVCGAQFRIETEIEYWYRCIKEGSVAP